MLRTPFFVRKDSGMRTIADLKGKRVTMGFSAMRDIDNVARSMLATAGLTEADVKPVLVPNVVRSADDFVAGASDMFFFAFGAAKVREVDVTVGGIRVLEIDPAGMPAARKIMPWAYLTDATPGPIFTGVEKPMKVYSFDNVIITNAKVPDDFIYKMLETMEKNKDDLIAVQPILRDFTGGVRLQAIRRRAVPLRARSSTSRTATSRRVRSTDRRAGRTRKHHRRTIMGLSGIRTGAVLGTILAIAMIGGGQRVGAESTALRRCRRARSTTPAPPPSPRW